MQPAGRSHRGKVRHHAAVLTRKGNDCFACPDAVRIERGCPKPLRDLRPPDRPNPPTCPVLDVPAWYWAMLDAGAMIERGAVDMTRLDAYTWELAVAVHAIHHEARRAADEAEKRMQEAKRKLFSEVLG